MLPGHKGSKGDKEMRWSGQPERELVFVFERVGYQEDGQGAWVKGFPALS